MHARVLVDAVPLGDDVLEAAGIKRRFSGPFFNEFVVRVANPSMALEAAERKQILAGTTFSNSYPNLADALLVSVTEMNRSEEFGRLALAISNAEVR